jgi:lipopolysaccharide transport system permease protein
VRIRPARGWPSGGWGELWQYRELLYFLVWRDLKVRYKQTALGVLWALLQPLGTMVIFSLFFGKLAGVPSDGIPYPLFSYAALVPWTFFANALNQSTLSVVGSAHLIKKVYFPRLIIPLSAILSGGLDFLIALVVFFGMAAAYGTFPPLAVLWLPLMLALILAVAVGAGLWLTAMNVQFRDVHHALPFLVQAWMFASPIAYPSSLLPEPWRTVYGVNPMAGIVEGFRWTLLGSRAYSGSLLAVSAVTTLVLLISGALYFSRMENTFADRL